MGELTEQELQSTEETPSQFLSQLYGNQHLITEESKQYYSETLPKGIEEWAKLNNFTEEDYIAIPIGSARTLPNKDSDIDLIVILNTEKEKPEDIGNYLKINKLYKPYEEKGLNLQVLSAYKSSELKILKEKFSFVSGEKQGGLAGSQLISALFLTPDELIYGNKKLAQKMRLEAVDFIEKRTLYDKYWKNGIEDSFKKYILNWPKQGSESKEVSRESRFNAIVESAKKDLDSKKEGLGEKWEIAFKDLLKNLKVPSFPTYRDALRADNGKLSIKNSRIKNQY